MSGDNRHIGQPAIDEERLDLAIDTVAREMTALEPSGDLKARVLDHLEQGRRRSLPAIPRWAWAVAPAAVVLAVVSAVWLAGPTRTPGKTETTLAEQRSGLAQTPEAGAERPAGRPAVSPDAGPPAGPPAGPTRTVRAAAARAVRGAGEDVLQDRHPVPALAAIEPLKFSAVEPDPLQIAAVEVAPFPEMPSIDIPSLGPGPNDIQSADPKKEQ